jgi:hypothetical protein
MDILKTYDFIVHIAASVNKSNLNVSFRNAFCAKQFEFLTI